MKLTRRSLLGVIIGAPVAPKTAQPELVGWIGSLYVGGSVQIEATNQARQATIESIARMISNLEHHGLTMREM